MKRPISLLLAAVLAVGPSWASAGTVICSTTTFSASIAASPETGKIAFPGAALPAAGAYAFDLVVNSTPTGTTPLTAMQVYLEQIGVDGSSTYAIPGSTFTACTLAAGGKCTYSIFPGVYEGGNVRCQWNVTSGSATIKVTARLVTP